VPAVIWFV
jgi:hypothetical protein